MRYHMGIAAIGAATESEMKNYSMHQYYQCAPAEFRKTKDVTGSFEMDCVIEKCGNKDMTAKIKDHLTEDVAYKLNTSYGRGPIG